MASSQGQDGINAVQSGEGLRSAADGAQGAGCRGRGAGLSRGPGGGPRREAARRVLGHPGHPLGRLGARLRLHRLLPRQGRRDAARGLPARGGGVQPAEPGSGHLPPALSGVDERARHGRPDGAGGARRQLLGHRHQRPGDPGQVRRAGPGGGDLPRRSGELPAVERAGPTMGGQAAAARRPGGDGAPAAVRSGLRDAGHGRDARRVVGVLPARGRRLDVGRARAAGRDRPRAARGRDPPDRPRDRRGRRAHVPQGRRSGARRERLRPARGPVQDRRHEGGEHRAARREAAGDRGHAGARREGEGRLARRRRDPDHARGQPRPRGRRAPARREQGRHRARGGRRADAQVDELARADRRRDHRPPERRQAVRAERDAVRGPVDRLPPRGGHLARHRAREAGADQADDGVRGRVVAARRRSSSRARASRRPSCRSTYGGSCSCRRSAASSSGCRRRGRCRAARASASARRRCRPRSRSSAGSTPSTPRAATRGRRPPRSSTRARARSSARRRPTPRRRSTASTSPRPCRGT